MGRQRIEKLMTDLKTLHGVTDTRPAQVEFPEGMKPADRMQALLWALKQANQ